MVRIGFVLTILVLLLASARPGLAQDRVLTFGPLPMEDPATVIQGVRPMLTYLETALGVRIRVAYSADYGELLGRFASGEIDVAYLGPLPYLALRDRYPQAEPLVHFLEASGRPTYTCALVRWGDDLPGSPLRVALTQPLSTCGWLSTAALLHQQGHDLGDSRYRYLDTHDAVALAVVRGEFDLGGLKTAIARRFDHLGLRIVAETAPLPSFALVANGGTLPAELRQALRQALVSLEAKGRDAAMLGQWGAAIRHGTVAAEDRDYDGVRALGARDAIPSAGNF